MSNKGITVGYAEFITSLSIHKGTVDINQKKMKKCEIGILLLQF